MSKLLMIVHCDKSVVIPNSVGKLVFHDESDRKKLEIYQISDQLNFTDFNSWKTRLPEIRSKYYSLLALDPEKRAINIVVLP